MDCGFSSEEPRSDFFFLLCERFRAWLLIADQVCDWRAGVLVEVETIT